MLIVFGCWCKDWFNIYFLYPLNLGICGHNKLSLYHTLENDKATPGKHYSPDIILVNYNEQRAALF